MNATLCFGALMTHACPGLSGTSGGLNNLGYGGATQVDPGIHNAWLTLSATEE